MKEIRVLIRRNTMVLTFYTSFTSSPSHVRLQPSLETKLSLTKKKKKHSVAQALRQCDFSPSVEAY